MSLPASNNNEPSKFNKLIKGNSEQPSIQSRLPRANGGTSDANTPSTPAPASPNPKAEPKPSKNSKIGPIFWTVASIISLLVNIGTVIALIVIVQLLGGPKKTFSLAQDQVNGLLGGLYTNFVKMDAATISTTIPVDASIPLNIVVPVQATTKITIAEAAVIPNAHVRIDTGALNIDANAQVTLPAGTPLVVKLDFPLTVQNSIPIHLDVPVNIPLNHTELHEPIVGLQKVVEPYYCFLQPNAQLNGIDICAGANTILPVAPVVTPQGTVIP